MRRISIGLERSIERYTAKNSNHQECSLQIMWSVVSTTIDQDFPDYSIEVPTCRHRNIAIVCIALIHFFRLDKKVHVHDIDYDITLKG